MCEWCGKDFFMDGEKKLYSSNYIFRMAIKIKIQQILVKISVWKGRNFKWFTKIFVIWYLKWVRNMSIH